MIEYETINPNFFILDSFKCFLWSKTRESNIKRA